MLNNFTGDCIHTVKPYFGVGVNSALEDVIVLDSALERLQITYDFLTDFRSLHFPVVHFLLASVII